MGMNSVCVDREDRAWTDPYRHDSERLQIWPCDAEAARALGPIAMDPRVFEPYYMKPSARSSVATVRENWYQSESDWRNSSRFNLAVRERRGGSVIGCVQLTPTHISYFVNPDFWNDGYGNEMVQACCRRMPQLLGISMLHARVFRENIASRRILENAGFLFSGIAPRTRNGCAGSATVLQYQRACALDAYNGH